MRRTDGDRKEPYCSGNGHHTRTRTTQFSRSQMLLRLSPLTASRANAAIGAGLCMMLMFLQCECKRDIDALRRIVLAVHWMRGGNR